MRTHPGFAPFSLLLRDGPSVLLRMRKGRRADRRKSYGSATLERIAAAPLGAPHTLLVRYPRFALLERMVALRNSSAWLFADDYAAAGRAFAVHLPPPSFVALRLPASPRRAQTRRGDGRRLAWTARSSASSWRGLVLGPGGAPLPPECPAAWPDPRAPHPVPHFTNASRKRPSKDETAGV